MAREDGDREESLRLPVAVLPGDVGIPGGVPSRSSWAAHVVVRVVAWLMIVMGVAAAVAAIAGGVVRTATGQDTTTSVVVLGVAFVAAGVALARRPYPRFAVRATIGAVLLPIGVFGVIHGIDDLVFAAEMREKAAEILVHPVDPDTIDWFQPTPEEADSFTDSTIRALLLNSVLLVGSLIATRSASTWGGTPRGHRHASHGTTRPRTPNTEQ